MPFGTAKGHFTFRGFFCLGLMVESGYYGFHHIGQMSVWSRELGRAPVSANFIERGTV